MRDSFIPMASNPTHDELLIAIKDGFAHFKQKMPTVTMEPVGPIHRDPYVKGDAENEWCWVSIDEQAIDERIPNFMKYLGAVSTRGDDLFAAVVAYSLCKKFGDSIDDNAGYLSAGTVFTLAEFEEALQARLDSRI
jgi:hypothetical protein